MFKMTYFHRFLQTIEGVLDNLLLLIFLLDNTKENTSSVTYKMFCVFLRGGRGVSARDRIGDGDLKVTRCTSFQTHTVQSHAIPPSPPCSTFTQLSKLPNFPLTSSGTVLFRLHGEKLKNQKGRLGTHFFAQGSCACISAKPSNKTKVDALLDSPLHNCQHCERLQVDLHEQNINIATQVLKIHPIQAYSLLIALLRFSMFHLILVKLLQFCIVRFLTAVVCWLSSVFQISYLHIKSCLQ